MAFMDEIATQGQALRDCINFYRKDGGELLRKAGHIAAHHSRSITFTGMGTSEFVPWVISDYLGDAAEGTVVIREAGELLHYGLRSIREDDLVIAVSQSGESIETRKVVEMLQSHRGLISVTNNPESTIARLSKLNLPMLAGEEKTIPDKTYTNSLAIMHILGRALVGRDFMPMLSELEDISHGMDSHITTCFDVIGDAAKLLRDAKSAHFVSRGPSMVAARQAAHTYLEGAHLFTCALPGGTMRHGPFEIVGPSHYAITFAPDGNGGTLVRNMSLDMADLGANVVIFTSKEAETRPNVVNIVLKPGVQELFPLTCAVPQELLMNRMATDRGLVAGVFEHTEKITVLEEKPTARE